MIKRNVKILFMTLFMICHLFEILAQVSVKQLVGKLEWDTIHLAVGLTWEHVHSRDSILFNSKQNINILRIQKNSNTHLLWGLQGLALMVVL